MDVAMAVGFGVHLGNEDMPISVARKIMGEDCIIGATAKTVEVAKKAEADGADYLGCGAIYPTKTHVKTKITSVETLNDICSAVKIPVCAIGGLNKDNFSVLEKSPIQGACVVSAIMDQVDTKKAAEESVNAFVEAVTESLKKGEKVQLVGFGSFEVRKRAARKGRNPQTKEEIKIPASKAPVFKAGKSLKEAINEA